jgi:hypothetical protein
MSIFFSGGNLDEESHKLLYILKAKEHNWGLIGPRDWENYSWKSNDPDYRIVEE